MSKALIIVESPAKARTISKFLGRDFVVESSIGHVRDLPSRAEEIPAQYRGKSWARTGVDVENGFKPLYIVPAQKKPQVKKLRDLLSHAKELYLATDEDREGEAIAWHLREVLQPKVPVKRMVFHEITEGAIKRALEHPRELDERLVDAQEARRILDRLYGYEVSPVLWKKVRPRLSAGRVQSVATRLIVERERARMAFQQADYWSVDAELTSNHAGANQVRAELVELDGRRLALGRDFDPNTGERTDAAKRDRVLLLDGPGARAIERDLRGRLLTVSDVQQKPFTQRPAPPFITSTLQQEAGRKLRFTAQRAMRIAQRLYENGYITYMRTDSTTLSEQALTAARNQVRELYGPSFLPDAPRVYTKKAKGAQEAHEAIRPAGESFRTPEELRAELDEDAFKLYDLIWKRTVASQMKDAQGQRTQMRFSVTLEASGESDGSKLACKAVLSASGKVITFPGFLRAYVEGSDDPEAELEEQERILPDLQVGDNVSATETWAKEHTTQPPARYTEASLVKELEDRGIGRPSTYASIIQTIQDRGYVWKKGGALVPTFTAFAVTNLLEKHFGELVDYEFTARMEGDLDEISHGDKRAEPWLERFFFGIDGRPKGPAGARRGTLSEVGLKDRIEGSVEEIDARRICSMPIGKTADGQELVARVGRYGPYLQVGDGDQRANLPDELEPDELNLENALKLITQAGLANRALGQHPATGQPVYLKTGRYGPYVQLGDPELTPKGNIKKGVKPKMSSLFPGMSLETLTLDDAVYLLSFPRTVGVNPDTDGTITAQDGQYGPYLTMETADGKRDSRSLENHDQLRNITLDEAVALFRQPKQRGRNRVQRSDLAELGTSPVTGKPIQVKTGRFGPYVTDGQVNATIPSNRDPAKLTHDDALELIAQREERMREQGKDPRPGAKKTLPVKKAAARLSARGDEDGEDALGNTTKGSTKKKSASAKKTTAKKAAVKKTAAKKSTVKKAAAKKAPPKAATSTKKTAAKKATSKKAAAAKKRTSS